MRYLLEEGDIGMMCILVTICILFLRIGLTVIKPGLALFLYKLHSPVMVLRPCRNILHPGFTIFDNGIGLQFSDVRRLRG